MFSTNIRTESRSSIRKAPAAILAGLLTVAAASAAGPHIDRYRTVRAAAPSDALKAANNDYRIVRLDVPDSVGAIAVDINNRGVVGGTYVDANGGEHTFLWDGAEYKKIISPVYPITSVPSITDSGRTLFGNWGTVDRQIAGTYDVRTGSFNALPDFENKPINLGYDMNNAGVAVGHACDGTLLEPFNCVGWIWTGTQYQRLEIEGVASPLPHGINDRGQIVGLYLKTPPFDFKAFLYEGGKGRILLQDTDAVAYDINNQGDISMLIEVSPQLPFIPALLESGFTEPKPLPSYPGSFTTLWVGMNERGDFAGFAPDPLLPERIALVLLRK